MEIKYVHIPESQRYYKACVEDGYFETLSYNPINRGHTRTLDRDSDNLTSGLLACACYPGMFEITEEEYVRMYQDIQKNRQN